MNRKGFSIYLTFLVTTVVFLLVTGSQEISMLRLDRFIAEQMNISRSDAIDVIAFHAADGGLEIGLAKLRQKYQPFSYSYVSELKPNRTLKVSINAIKNNNLIDINSEAILMEGNKEVSRRTLSRIGISKSNGRNGCGKFTEAI